MTPAANQDTTVSRLTRAAEELSILGHELAAATPAVSEPVPGGSEAARKRAAAIAGILQSTSDRMREHVLALIEIAYAQNEEAIAASGDLRAERSAVALGRIARTLEPVFELAHELAGRLRAAQSIVDAQGRRLQSTDLTALNQPICDLLEHAPMATGAGIVIAPGLLEDRELWMQWWVTTHGAPSQLHLQFEPGQPRFYDYRQAIWYQEPAGDLVSHLAPPHFDEGGTDRYMITATTPALIGRRYLGLGCAELTLEHLAELVAPALQTVAAPAALITPTGLIAASTDPTLRPADRIPAPLAGQIAACPTAPFVEVARHVTLARSSALPWLLVSTWASASSRR